MKSRLRDVRKPRHGWYDYEIYDVFGDELGDRGIGVYLVFTRFCYGNVRVRMSLRELAANARMSKDTFARNLKKVVELGLIIEHKGPTAQSVSVYELVDVKELAAKYMHQRKGVSGRDTFTDPAEAEATDLSESFDDVKSRVDHGDGSATMQRSLRPISRVDVSQGGGGDCLTVRQMQGEAEGSEGEGSFETEVSQNQGGFETEVSQMGDGLINKKQETRNKNPQAPASGSPGGSSLVLPFDDCRHGEAGFAISLGIAAGWVRRECNIANSRLDRTIATTLEQRAEAKGESLQVLAKLAVDRHWEYLQAESDGLLRWREQPANFFLNGAWLTPASWPWKHEAVERREAAAIGVSRPAEATPADEAKRIRAYLDEKAAAIEACGIAPEIAAELRALDTGGDVGALESALEQLEERLTLIVMGSSWPEELESLRKATLTELGDRTVRMNPVQLERVIANSIERKLFKDRGLSNLSLFYMPKRSLST